MKQQSVLSMLSLWPWLLLIWNNDILLISSTLSNPFRADGSLDHLIPEYNEIKKGKAYHNMTPVRRHDVLELDSQLPSCGVNPKVKWSSVVGSSVYSTPVIFPSGPDGTKQIFVNTFYQFVEVLGYDGYKPWGFPLGFDSSSFQSSPILYDIDGDGTNDLAVIDKNANLYWIRLGEFGQYLEDFHIQVPKLKVKKDWADGMDPAFLDSYVMTSMFDHRFEEKKTTPVVRPDDLRGITKRDNNEETLNQRKLQVSEGKVEKDRTTYGVKHWTGRVLMAIEGEGDREIEPLEEEVNEEILPEARASLEGQEELETNAEPESPEEEVAPAVPPAGDDDRTRESREWEEKIKRENFQHADEEEGEHREEEFNEEYAPPHWDDALADPINPVDGGDPMQWTDDYNIQRYRHRSSYFGDDYLASGYGSWGYNDSHFAFVDAHVLASASLADINNDGDMELIIPISYYFDKELYRGKDLGFDPDNFIAGGIGCWNIHKEQWTWLVHLDLTTDKTKFKALIHSSPTIADLDGDGRSEIIIGTSLGLLYVLDGDTGFSRRFFPMQFHEIQSQVAVADLRGGPDLEMIVGDLAGNVVCVNIDGDVLWDARLSGGVYQPATIGDVDGDGVLDVVVSVSAYDGYHIYALRGDTGETLAGYPIALPEGGEVSGAILLVDLHNYAQSRDTPLTPSQYSDPYAPQWTARSQGHAPAASPSMLSEVLKESQPEPEGEREPQEGEQGEEESGESRRRLDNLDPLSHKPRAGRGGGAAVQSLSEEEAKKRERSQLPKGRPLHLLVPSFDGHLYIFDGTQRCAERIDLGDHIFSTPLVDDVTGDGNLDIVVGTVTGHVHVLETQIPHHPLNSWSSFPKHRGNVFTHGQVGLSIPLRERKLLRQTDVKGGSKLSLTFDIWDTRPLPETTAAEGSLRRYSVAISRGTNRQEVLLRQEFSRPGRYTVQLPLSPPEKTLLVVGMTTDHAQYFEETLMLEVSTKFYIWIKYLVLIPLALLIAPLLFIKPQQKF